MARNPLDKETAKKLSALKEIIAENLRRQRKKLEFTQEKIAEECGVNVSIVQRLEAAHLDDPVLSTFLKISQGYKIPFQELFKKVKK